MHQEEEEEEEAVGKRGGEIRWMKAGREGIRRGDRRWSERREKRKLYCASNYETTIMFSANVC